MIHLDTHVVVWLYESASQRLPQRAIDLIERERAFISPMVRLELSYLHEINRLRVSGDAILSSLANTLALAVDACPFALVVEHATRQTWTRDPFDRLIVGQALARDAPLITADQTIRANYPAALWD